MKRFPFFLGFLLLLAGCTRPHNADSRPETSPPEAAAPDSASTAGEAPPEAPDFTVAGLETPAVRTFFDTLQQAVARDDRMKVASLVAYPITVQLHGEPTTLKDAADFVAHYSDVMSSRIRAAVEAARMDDLFVNWQGVRIGKGEIWFGGVYEDDRADEQAYTIKIVAINTDA